MNAVPCTDTQEFSQHAVRVIVFFCACLLPIYSGISEREVIEAICSNDACYTVDLSKETFIVARKECAKRKGDLVTIQNEDEAERVYSLLWKFTNITLITHPLKLWIGLQLKLKSCVKRNQALEAFLGSQTQYTTEGHFSNWLTEPMVTCVREKCMMSMKLQMDSPDNYKWTDEPCSSQADGYICKCNFQGMCQPVTLAGLGYVEYDTPFSIKSSSLDLVPPGSLASVSCGHTGNHTRPSLACLKSEETHVYQWGNFQSDKKSTEPFCASEELDCKYNNGGCEHECVENPQNKFISCRCSNGYMLAPDSVSCIYADHYQSNPCEQSCINYQNGFTCSCSSGFALAENRINCNNIKGCLHGECDPRINNDHKNEELESKFDTTSSIQRKDEHPRTTPHPITDTENNKEDPPKIARSTLMASVGIVSTSDSPVNDASDCIALRLGSKLLLSILCIGAVYYSA
ncbi:complement component C1q receptor-like [Dendrobates tinctorius]|uniref:complement component C1q receptor-like n=1 Tax=Dendrobates tinctorius TaxID=92724 RepID=UPI003CCA4224